MKNLFLTIVTLLTISFVFTSCSKDDPQYPTFEAFGTWKLDSVVEVQNGNYINQIVDQTWIIQNDTITTVRSSGTFKYKIISYDVNNKTIDIETYGSFDVDTTHNLSNIVLFLTRHINGDFVKYSFTSI